MTHKFTRIAAAVAVAVAGAAGSAVAAPLTQLYFNQTSAWSNFQFSAGGLAQGLVPSSSSTALSWTSDWNGAAPGNGGGNGNTSSLTISSFNSGTTPTSGGAADQPVLGQWNAGDWYRIDKLVQHNEVLTVQSGVPNPNPLWTADILGNFKAWTDGVGGSNKVLDDSTTTKLTYWETTNTNTPGQCTSPNPLGSACDDIYTVLQLSLNPLSFIYDGYRYTISFRLETDSALVCDWSQTSGPCATESGAQPGSGELLKVYAKEGENSTIFVAASWAAEQIPVPEPSVMALMGAGVLGLGMAARRRRNASK